MVTNVWEAIALKHVDSAVSHYFQFVLCRTKMTYIQCYITKCLSTVRCAVSKRTINEHNIDTNGRFFFSNLFYLWSVLTSFLASESTERLCSDDPDWKPHCPVYKRIGLCRLSDIASQCEKTCNKCCEFFTNLTSYFNSYREFLLFFCVIFFNF